MSPGDGKYWLQAARSLARNPVGASDGLRKLRREISDRLGNGASIADVVRAWDSLVRNPNDQRAAEILFLALDTGTGCATLPTGTAVGLGIVFTVQFKEDFSFQLTDEICLAPETVEDLVRRLFRGSGGRPVFARRLLHLLQVEVAMLTPDRLGRSLRNAIQHSVSGTASLDVVPSWPDGITLTVHSKPEPQHPYVIFTAVLPGYLWFDGQAGAEEIESVWLATGQLRDAYDFAELDEICARVQADLNRQFAGVVSTKMNPVPMRLMSAGQVLTRRDSAAQSAQRAALRALGHY